MGGIFPEDEAFVEKCFEDASQIHETLKTRSYAAWQVIRSTNLGYSDVHVRAFAEKHNLVDKYPSILQQMDNLYSKREQELIQEDELENGLEELWLKILQIVRRRT